MYELTDRVYTPRGIYDKHISMAKDAEIEAKAQIFLLASKKLAQSPTKSRKPQMASVTTGAI
jgi:hypothetical protein